MEFQLPKLNPTVGGGLGGLPQRSETVQTSIVDTTTFKQLTSFDTNIAFSGTVNTCNPLMFRNGKAVIRTVNTVANEYKYYVYDYDVLGNLTNEFISTPSATDTENTLNGRYDRFQHQCSDTEILSWGQNSTYYKYIITGTTLTFTTLTVPNSGTYTVGGGTWSSFSAKNTIIKNDVIYIYGIDNSGYLVCHKYDYNFTLLASIKNTLINMAEASGISLDVWVDDNFIALVIGTATNTTTASTIVYIVDDNHVRISTATANLTATSTSTLTKAFSYYDNGFISVIFANTASNFGIYHLSFNVSDIGIVTSAFPNQTYTNFSGYVLGTKELNQTLSLVQVRGLFGVNNQLSDYTPTNMSNTYDGKDITPLLLGSTTSTSYSSDNFCQSKITASNKTQLPAISIRPIRNDIVYGSIKASGQTSTPFPHTVGNFVTSGTLSVAGNIKFSIGVLS